MPVGMHGFRWHFCVMVDSRFCLSKHFFFRPLVDTCYCFSVDKAGKKCVTLMCPPPPPHFLGSFPMCYSMSEIACPVGHMLQEPRSEYTGSRPCDPLPPPQ